MRLAIIDDSENDRNNLNTLLTKCLKPREFNQTNTIDVFNSGNAFLTCFQPCKYDAIFLDILMDTLSGVETARKIRSLDENVRLIFVTSSNDYASESYEVHASGYLLKPFDQVGLQKILDMLSVSIQSGDNYIMLPDGTQLIPRNIIYTEYYNRHILVHQKQGGNLCLRISQAEVERCILPHSYFVNCFRGIIVNLYEVKQLHADYLIMNDETRIPISRRKAAETKNLWSEFLFEKVRREVND